MMSGETRAGKLVFRTQHEISAQLRSKYVTAMSAHGLDSEAALLTFQTYELENILLEADSLACR